MDLSDYLSPRDVAALKRVSEPTVYRAINDGRLPHKRFLGRIGIHRADAELWQPSTHGGKRPGQGRPRKT